MTKRIITISREFGSGGHTIGKAVAERMGVSFYDSQLISKVAKQSGLSEEFIRDNEEYASHANSFLYQIAMSAAGSYGYPSIYQKLYEAQTHVIEELAEKEEYVESDTYIEDVARDQLGMVKEGETVFYPAEETAEVTPSPEPGK